MTHLLELVSLLGPDFSLCTCTNQARDATQKLYLYLTKNDTPTDAGAAALLKLDENAAAYRKIKHLLKIELLNAVASIKPKDQSADKRQRSYAYVWKLIAIAKQLRTSTHSAALLSFLEEAFKKARRLEMLDAAYQSASMLRRQYNNRRFDAERYAYYRDQALHYRDLARAYEDVVADLNEIVYMRNSRAEAEDIRALAQSCYLKNHGLIERYDTAIITYIVYLTQLNAFLADGNYRGVIEVAKVALDYLDEKPTAQAGMFQVFEANLSVAYTQINDYENGMKFARQLLAKTGSSDHNYLKVYELMLILTLRAGRFQEAYDTYREIDPASLTNDLRGYYSETFRILEAYLYLLTGMGQVVTDAEDDLISRFRVKRFVNSFTDSQREKSYRNVHLLIVQIVDDIVGKRHNSSVYSIEAIGKYAQRHLRGRGHERVKYFLKALSQLSVQRFHRSAVERHTHKYVKTLSKYSIADSNQDYYMELIPFELLWRLILEQLGYKRLRVVRRRKVKE